MVCINTFNLEFKMENYSIVDIDNFAIMTRENVAKSFSEDYSENLDDFISIQQVIDLVEQHSLGQDDDGYEIINADIFNDIFDDLREWMYGVALAKLAGKNMIECAWDDDVNEMVFWISDKEKTKVSNKPTK